MAMETYTIYCISNSPYQEWQADLLDYTFAKVKQPGRLIRVCAEDVQFPGREQNESRVGETVFTPNYSKINWPYVRVAGRHIKVFWSRRKIEWPVMNKPGSLKCLFENRDFGDDDKLIFLDPDMVFAKPWNPKVEQGKVHGQMWIGYGRRDCENASIHPELCPKTARDCVMYPYAIKASDMKRIVSDIERLARAGYTKARRLKLGDAAKWMADMPAFQTAMIGHGLIMDAVENIGLCNNWDICDDEEAPILHYCQPMRGRDGKVFWDKREYKPWDIPPDPSLAMNRVDREVLRTLREKIGPPRK
jgi:hypothetical protein